LKSLYGWLVITVASILSINSVITGVSLISAVKTLQAGKGEGDVKGTVVDYEDHPLEGAYVWIEKGGAHTWSGKEGNFTLKNVGTGIYTISFWKLGFERVSIPISVFPESMVGKWEGLNELGEIALRREFDVNETMISTANLTIMVNYSWDLRDLSYTLSTPAGTAVGGGALENNLTLAGLTPGTYLLGLSGDNVTRTYTFYLPPEGKVLRLDFEGESGRKDLRSLSTLSIIASGERTPEWIAINLTDICTGWSFEGVFNITDSLTITVMEGLYNLTVGSPYSGSTLYTNISTPHTLGINLTFSPVEERSASMSVAVAIAIFYVLIGVFGAVGAVLVYMRKRFRTALLSLLLLMFSPTPSVFICSLGVLLGLASIFMLYRIRGEFEVGDVSGSSSDVV